MAYQEREYAGLSCLISTPPGQPPSGGWPVLLFLHGHLEAAPAELHAALTAHGPLRASSGVKATRRFVIVAPQLPAPGGDVWGSRAEAVGDISRATARDYQGDATRCYLTGFSYGANGVLDIAPRQGDLWAALWPVDPTRVPEVCSARPIWVSAGNHARQHRARFRTVWNVQDLVRDAPRSPDRVYEDAGLTHVPTATAAYGNDAIYEWLLRHHLGR